MDQSTSTSHSVAAGNGLQWIVDGFTLFKKNIGIWIALIVILIVGSVIIGIIPFVGFLALTLIHPVLVGGLMVGCKALDEGRELEITHLFSGFEKNTTQLFLIGVFYLVATIGILIIVFITAGGAIFAGMSGHIDNITTITAILLGLLIALALYVPVLMAIWFAPALVILDNVDALPAMKKSFIACLKNIVPFLIYGIVALVLSLLAIIPFGLGFLILGPIMTASIYTSYRDVFHKTSQP